jgi:hypothetical protein
MNIVLLTERQPSSLIMAILACWTNWLVPGLSFSGTEGVLPPTDLMPAIPSFNSFPSSPYTLPGTLRDADAYVAAL